MEFIYQLIQDENHSKTMAACKFIEEAQEFLETTYEEYSNIEKTLEEGFDVIQTVLSYWDTIGITKKEIFNGFKKHNEKLENRGWDRKAMWRIEDVEDIY